MASATIPAPQGAGADVIVGRDDPGAPHFSINTASAPERKWGGADVDAETVRQRIKQICTAPQGSPEGAASLTPSGVLFLLSRR